MSDTMEITDSDLDGILSGVDPDAPYGRFANGKPRKSPKGSTSRAAIPSVPGPRKTAAPRPSSGAAGRKGQPDYAAMAGNVVQLPVIALSMLGTALQPVGDGRLGTALALDGMTVGLYKDQIADLGKRMAEADGRVARWLERFGKGGVYGEAIALGSMIGAQFMVNHGRMRPVPAAGLLEPQEIYNRAQGIVADPADSGPGDAVPDS